MRTILLSLFLLSSVVVAKPNVPVGDFKAKIAKIAGAPGPFVKNEAYPKDYFLVTKNLPFLVGAVLHHPKSSTLDLSKDQIDTLLAHKKTTLKKVFKLSNEIKALEIELAKEIGLKYKSIKIEKLFPKVDKISQLKTELTKAHLKCIEGVKNILTEEQYTKLLKYLVVNK